MSSRRLQDVFSVTIFRLPKRLKEDVLQLSQRHLKDNLKTSCKTKKCYTEDVFKTSSRHLQHVFTKTNVCWVIADFKISLYVSCYLKKNILCKFRIPYPHNSRVICPRILYFFKESSLFICIFYCFCMFANEHFAFRKCAYPKN